MTGIIDRFEGEYAVVELEDRQMKNIPRAQLPPQAAEGDVLRLDPPIRIDAQKTAERKERIRRMAEQLWK